MADRVPKGHMRLEEAHASILEDGDVYDRLFPNCKTKDAARGRGE